MTVHAKDGEIGSVDDMEPAASYMDENGVTHIISGDPIPEAGESFPTPTHWPTIPAVDVTEEWNELRDWVEQLKARFPVLDHHVIPPCWWRHNQHVEVLAALKDHEEASYMPIGPATDPVEWMRALRDMTNILGAWTAELSCGATHQDPSPFLRAANYDSWDEHLQDDVDRRSCDAIARSV